MVSIVLSGASGKMGLEFVKVVKASEKAKIIAGIDLIQPNYLNSVDFSVYENFSNLDVDVDVIVDFSNPSALNKILNFAEKNKVAVVLATTGYNAGQIEQIKEVSKYIPIFFSFNMSIGINLLINLIKKAFSVLNDDFDVEIVEKHHNQKIDAPSGTALMLANALNEISENELNFVYDRHKVRQKRDKAEIGMHSIRGGTIVGEHEVIFAGKDEIITISHSARSKQIFAEGALKAALFIKSAPAGMYDMDNLINISHKN